jgi:hypothetical protein
MYAGIDRPLRNEVILKNTKDNLVEAGTTRTSRLKWKSE